MGTTVTPNLGLIKPDIDEKIKDDNWVDQHSANLNRLDASLRVLWTDEYNPVWDSTGTNPTLGTGGSVSGSVAELSDKFIITWIRLDVGGSGFNAGTGFYQISLPFNNPVAGDRPDVMGAFILRDDTVATNRQLLLPQFSSTNIIRFYNKVSSLWNNSNPFILAQNDKLAGYLMYPRG